MARTERANRARYVVKTQAEVCKFFDVAPQTVQLWVRSGMPGRPGRYDLAKVAQWREDKRAAKEREKAADPAAANLDRYRLAKAELAVLELEERRGILLPVARVKEGLLRVATMIRRLSERLGQQYGDEATYAVNETVQEFERIITSEINGTHVDTTAN